MKTGRVTSVAVPGISGSETTSYTFDAANRMLTTTFANGDVETDTYDGTTADLDSVVHTTSASATIASYTNTYNSDGRKTADTLADGSYYSYGYDAAGQLTSESLNSGGSGTIGALHGYSYTYSYDAAGNRASKYNGTSTDTYAYDNANKLTSAGVKSYSYDSAGNCTSVANSATSDTVTLAYDGENRMKSASDSASTFSDTYSYNGLDQRVGKIDNGGTFAYTRESDAIDGSVLADGAAVYNHGAGSGLISEYRSGTSKYYHSDALGSTGALTNSSEGVTDTHVTDAFGMAVTGTGTTPTPFGFVGQGGYQSDADTGLMLCGHRYYDDSTGRFLSRDPARAGENWYAYGQNDSANEIDPQGLDVVRVAVNPGGLGQGSHAMIYITDANGKTGTWYGFYPDNPNPSDTSSGQSSGSTGSGGSYGSSGSTSQSSGGTSGGSSNSLSGIGSNGSGYVNVNDDPAPKAKIVSLTITPAQSKMMRKAVWAKHPNYAILTYNCSTWASDVIRSALPTMGTGILTPKELSSQLNQTENDQ